MNSGSYGAGGQENAPKVPMGVVIKSGAMRGATPLPTQQTKTAERLKQINEVWSQQNKGPNSSSAVQANQPTHRAADDYNPQGNNDRQFSQQAVAEPAGQKNSLFDDFESEDEDAAAPAPAAAPTPAAPTPAPAAPPAPKPPPTSAAPPPPAAPAKEGGCCVLQ
mmetsp:Transcript_13418/g.35704  ORF Transcript_13418/g.35704 Transcript_13418/m.35704 type:complete len:164 (+) Transcript_13418:177-668(+)